MVEPIYYGNKSPTIDQKIQSAKNEGEKLMYENFKKKMQEEIERRKKIGYERS